MKFDPIEELRLHAYPTPERKGCPDSDVIRAMANREVPHGEPRWEHIWHCSPCFAEFKELRDARRAQQRRRHFNIWLTFAAIVVCIVVIFFGIRQVTRTRSPNAQIVANNQRGTVGELDFRNPVVERDVGAEDAKDQVLAKSTRELEIILPMGSEAGDYALEIRTAARMNEPIAKYRGEAPSAGAGLMKLRAQVDLSPLAPGHYVAAWQQLGAASWDYGRFVLK